MNRFAHRHRADEARIQPKGTPMKRRLTAIALSATCAALPLATMPIGMARRSRWATAMTQ